MKTISVLFVIIFSLVCNGQEKVKNDSLEISRESKSVVLEGNVTDANGVDISGVEISVKGTLLSTTTNFDGIFYLNIKAGAILVVHCKGFKTKEITLSDQLKIHIILEERTSSNEEVKEYTKSDLRKKKRSDRQVRRAQALEEFLLEEAERKVNKIIRKRRRNR